MKYFIHPRTTPAITAQVFTYLKCEDVETALAALATNKYIRGITSYYLVNGKLTLSQRNMTAKIIKERTGINCTIYEPAYNVTSTAKTVITRKAVHTNYHNLIPIPARDLPFDKGAYKEVILHPYNSHSVVLEYKGNYYKIPKPIELRTITEATQVSFMYHQTPMKGYLKNLNYL